MRVGYAKLGRSIGLNRDKFGFAGDAEAPQLLARLARRNPDITWVLTGKNSKDKSFELPSNVVNPWTDYDGFTQEDCEDLQGSLDGIVIHAGNHAPLHQPIPKASTKWEDNDLAKPFEWAKGYGGYIIRGMNKMGDRTDGKAPVVWIVTDPRNYLKGRDIKWPTGTNKILAQYHWDRQQRHERWQDPRSPEELGFGDWCVPERDGELWYADHSYRYSGIELMILPDDWQDWPMPDFDDRIPAGIATTSFSKNMPTHTRRRSEYVRDYLLTTFPDAEVFGKWDEGSLKDVPEGTVTEAPVANFYEQLKRWRITLSLPAVGTSWTVAKPFQCWASGVATFMVGRLDDQGWVLPSRRKVSPASIVYEDRDGPLYSVRTDWTDDDFQLARWLRIEHVDEFERLSKSVVNDRSTWAWIARRQYDLLKRRWDDALTERIIEHRLVNP